MPSWIIDLAKPLQHSTGPHWILDIEFWTLVGQYQCWAHLAAIGKEKDLNVDIEKDLNVDIDKDLDVDIAKYRNICAKR